ncbi:MULTISPECIES: hypothetical protein [unclassified Streptomyces]|uniref:hypothetical protein n=1 Tax=unclassified Streptomyces TaxID=2593676 RepID=UPI0036F18B17
MTLMTHARARLEPGTADYNTLTPEAQQDFDEAMDDADSAGPHDYPVYMKAIAILVGLPAGDIRKCACSCWCGTVFDSNAADAHVIEHGEGYNLGRHQCPTCADRHRETA